MLNLINLEFKKNQMNGYIKGAFITLLCIILFLCFVTVVEMNLGNFAFQNFSEAFDMVGSLTSTTFMIFGSVLISRFIIEEYKNNTISLLFMYPISRKKLLTAKLIIVASFIFTTILFSNLIIWSLLWAVNNFTTIIPEALTLDVISSNFVELVFVCISISGIGLIPLYFGMRKKSVPATIVSSILIISILSSNSGGVSLLNIVIVPILLALVGVLIAYLAIRKVDKLDII